MTILTTTTDATYSHKAPRLSKLNRQILELLDPSQHKPDAYYEMALTYCSINESLGKDERERPNTWRCLKKMVQKGLLLEVELANTRYAGRGYYTNKEQPCTGYMVNDIELYHKVVHFNKIRNTEEHIQQQVDKFFKHFGY